MADVGISVKLDGIAAATADLNKLNTNLAGTEAQTKKTSAAVNGITGAFGKMRGMVAALGLVYATRETIKLSDAMTNMRSRIQLVVGSTEKAVATQQKLMEVSNRTRTNFESVGALYARIGRSADELKLSQERLIGFTETFSQALQISGASSGEAASTILQLSQALASGRLQGAELNAVLESGGRAAQAIADGLGVPIGALKKLGEQGELTADRVIRAIESQASVINKEFTSMEVTVGSSLTVLENSFAEMINKVNSSSGATKGLATQILDLSKMIRDPDFVNGIAKIAEAFVMVGKNAAWALSVVGNSVRGAAQAVFDANEFIGKTMWGDLYPDDAYLNNRRIGSEREKAHAAAKRGIKGRVKTSNIGNSGGDGGGGESSAEKAAKQKLLEFKDYLESLRDEYDALEAIQEESWSAAAELIEATRTPVEQYRIQLENLNALFEGGFMSGDEYNRVIDDMNRALAESNQSVMAIEDAFESAFDAAISGTDDLEGALTDIGKSLASDLFKTNIFNPAKNSLNSMIGGLLGGGGKSREGSPIDMLNTDGGAAATDTFLSRLSDIFGGGDEGFIGRLGALFNGEEGVIGKFAGLFGEAWTWMGDLLTSFLTELGLMQMWEMAERWRLTLWEMAERWAIAAVEAAASFLGFERGGELTVTRPTLFMAGEKNKAERVRVSPLSGGQRGESRGGGGGFAAMSGSDMKGGATTNVQVFIPPTSVISGLTEGAFARTITKAVRRQQARTV
jgi:tape measure domain-containing protein